MEYLISVPFSLYFNVQSGMSAKIAYVGNLLFRSVGQFELRNIRNNNNTQDRSRKSARVRDQLIHRIESELLRLQKNGMLLAESIEQSEIGGAQLLK